MTNDTRNAEINDIQERFRLKSNGTKKRSISCLSLFFVSDEKFILKVEQFLSPPFNALFFSAICLHDRK